MSDTNSTSYLEKKLTKAEITQCKGILSRHYPFLLPTTSLRLRAEMKNNQDKKKLAWERRHELDAEYREVKVVKNHGINAYMDDYVPLLNEFNSYRLVTVKVKLSKDEKEAVNGSGEDEGEE
ncbi:hypothetical protein B0H13DRAFT_1878507 [Mycena leptocephala]|nr:hypothetical protein B0H13DRAFT_1878507 [Mycena leptocephala]